METKSGIKSRIVVSKRKRYAARMDDPNMTMEEYIKLEEEKASELPAIVIDDTVTPQDVLPCKSQVSTPVNDEIDFRISFDESDDEDYTITCDINSEALLCFIMNLYVPLGILFDPKRYYKDGDCAIMLRRPRYHGLEYTDEDIADFKEKGMPAAVLMRDGLFGRMRMEHRDDAGVVVFTSRAWGRLFDTRGPLVRELILEFLSMLRFGEVLLDLDALSTIQFQLGGARRRLS
ncbi:hypothetical protein Tco_0237715 [Tanacetum coccineum]